MARDLHEGLEGISYQKTGKSGFKLQTLNSKDTTGGEFRVYRASTKAV